MGHPVVGENFNNFIREETTMKHKVVFSIPERELGKADIEFKVKSNNRVFGTLKISRVPHSFRSAKFRRLQQGYVINFNWASSVAHIPPIT